MAGYFVVAVTLGGLTTYLTRSEAAIMILGVAMAMIGGVLAALVAERMSLHDWANRTSRD